MKQLNITFEDAEFERVIKAKNIMKEKSWHDTILKYSDLTIEKEEEKNKDV